VDVVGADFDVKIALDTFEVLDRSGKVPPKVLRRVTALLREHQHAAIAAFHATAAHRFPGTLAEQQETEDE